MLRFNYTPHPNHFHIEAGFLPSRPPGLVLDPSARHSAVATCATRSINGTTSGCTPRTSFCSRSSLFHLTNLVPHVFSSRHLPFFRQFGYLLLPPCLRSSLSSFRLPPIDMKPQQHRTQSVDVQDREEHEEAARKEDLDRLIASPFPSPSLLLPPQKELGCVSRMDI